MTFILQLIKFGLVGACAALTNFLIVIFLVEQFNFNPLFANVFAFFTAFNVSYFGHRYFTFTACHISSKVSLIKFFLVAGSSFLLNESLFYLFLDICHFYYVVAMLITLLIVPFFTFVVSKFWVFKI